MRERAGSASAEPLLRALLVAALLGASACETAVGDGATTRPGQGGSPQNGGSAGGGEGEPGLPGEREVALPRVLPCGQATESARAVLDQFCAGCHGADSPKKGGFGDIDDVAALIASGKVVPSQAEASPLYARIADGVMPPAQAPKRPGAAELKSLRDWIACGAPDWHDESATSLQFVDIDTRVRTVLTDLRAMPNPVDRQRMRYIDLSTLANAGYSDAQLEVYREAVFFLLNSLSRGRTVIAPRAIDAQRLLLRMDMRDYQWTAQSWRLLEQSYPYAVIYDKNSRLFPFDEVSSDQVRRETGTRMPIMQADWLLSHAVRPPLYQELLELPQTLAGLESALGVDIDADVASEQVLRAGFANASASRNHGVIERHDLGGDRGALWVSYDFSSTLGQRNVFVNPFDFEADTRSLIFNLDNGLSAYLMVDASGRRIDKAPNAVLQDPLARDGAVETGSSCVSCHQTDGVITKFDEVLDFLRSSANAQVVEAALGVYTDRATLGAAFTADQERYRRARAELDLDHLEDRTLRALDNTHLGLLDINAAAAAIGIPASELQRALDASTRAFPPEVVALRVLGGGVQRDAFDAVVGQVIEALGLGTPLRAGNELPPPPSSGDLDGGVQQEEDAGARDAGAGKLDAGAPPLVDAGSDEGKDAAPSDGGRWWRDARI